MPVRMGCYIKYECYKKGRISIFVNHNLSFVQIIKPLTLKWVTFYEFEICLKFWYLITFSYIIHRLSIEQVYKTQVYLHLYGIDIYISHWTSQTIYTKDRSLLQGIYVLVQGLFYLESGQGVPN